MNITPELFVYAGTVLSCIAVFILCCRHNEAPKAVSIVCLPGIFIIPDLIHSFVLITASAVIGCLVNAAKHYHHE